MLYAKDVRKSKICKSEIALSNLKSTFTEKATAEYALCMA